MHLISVNIGIEREILYGKKSGRTGIFKEPAAGAVQLTPLGFVGDAVLDSRNHGGPDQAVYVYTAPDYDWWSAELGREVTPGTFGENLTISGIESAALAVGDVLRVGQAVLQVSAPRIPCSTLAARMGDSGFIRRFRESGRPGVYCRVLQPGFVQAGDAVALEAYTGETVSVREMFEEFYQPHTDESNLRRYLAAPIAIRARQDKEGQLAKLRVA